MKVMMESTFRSWHRFEAEYAEYMLPAHDGVELFTAVFSPAADSKGPVVVIRSPYETDAPHLELYEGLLADLVDNGYIIVYQHCRGCGRSNGECVPYLNERQDGLALLAWIRKQPFYAEEIFLTGGSYLSSVHLSYLNAAGNDIKGAVLGINPSPALLCLRQDVFSQLYII